MSSGRSDRLDALNAVGWPQRVKIGRSVLLENGWNFPQLGVIEEVSGHVDSWTCTLRLNGGGRASYNRHGRRIGNSRSDDYTVVQVMTPVSRMVWVLTRWWQSLNG